MKKVNKFFIRRSDMMSLLFTLSDLNIFTSLELKDFTQDIHGENEIEKVIIQASGGRYRLTIDGKFINLYETQETLIEAIMNPEKRVLFDKKIAELKNE